MFVFSSQQTVYPEIVFFRIFSGLEIDLLAELTSRTHDYRRGTLAFTCRSSISHMCDERKYVRQCFTATCFCDSHNIPTGQSSWESNGLNGGGFLELLFDYLFIESLFELQMAKTDDWSRHISS